MATLELTLQAADDGAFRVVGECRLSAQELPTRRQAPLQLDRDALRAASALRDYGELLGRALFQGELRDLFSFALAQPGQLRVLLNVEATELSGIRWERLCAPIDGGFRPLATEQRAVPSHYIPASTDRAYPPIGRRDLRALVVVASPDNLADYRFESFDVDAAVHSVIGGLGEIPADVVAGRAGERRPTLDVLCELLTSARYTILHLVCHGQFSARTGETAIYLANDDGNVSVVRGEQLIERLGSIGTGLPRLIFLGSCETATAEAEMALGGLGQRLVRRLGTPAVIAMTETVTVATAYELNQRFYPRLRDHGEVDRALVEACAGMAEGHNVTVPALFSRLGDRPLFSDDARRPLSAGDIEFGLQRLRELIAARAPVLARDLELHAAVLARTAPVAEEQRTAALRAEHDAAMHGVEAICDEAVEAPFALVAAGKPLPPCRQECPFPGLRSFTSEDTRYFFGREALVGSLGAKLRGHPFLAVLGASGSGKSSAVLAGLVPALQREQPGLAFARFTPGQTPLVALESAIAALPAARALSAELPAAPPLIVVDQLEEVFTLCKDSVERQAFFARLLDLCGPLRVVATMRADFWGECAPHPRLREAMTAHQELVGPMTPSELRSAIEQQAGAADLRLEAGLSDRILEQVSGEPGAMPLLQHALLELWKRRHGRWLRYREYEALGGVQQGIARSADEIYEGLPDADKARMRELFLQLTRLGDESAGDARNTRRRVALDDLVASDEDRAPLESLVLRLADARLVVTSSISIAPALRGGATSSIAASGSTLVEVAHEALLRHWPRLHDWIEANRAALKLGQDIQGSARDWERSGRNAAYLEHRGLRLEEVRDLLGQKRLTLYRLEREYVEACVEAEQRAQRDQLEQQQRELAAARKIAEEAQARSRVERQAAADAQKAALRQKQRTRIATALGALAVVAALASLALYRTAQRERQIADAARVKADRASKLAREKAEEANLRLANLLREQGRFAFLAGNAGHAMLYLTRRLDVTEPDTATRTLLSLAASSSIDALASTLTGHSAIVNSVASCAIDGKVLLASGSGDSTVRIWDATLPRRPELLSVLADGDAKVDSVAFSSDCSRIVSAHHDGQARLWDAHDPRRVGRPRLLGQPGGRMTAAIFSPDASGATIATAGFAQPVRLWNAASGQEIARFGKPAASVRALAFSPDGKQLASAQGREVVIWDSRTQKVRGVLSGHGGSVFSVAFSPGDGTAAPLIATASADNTARLWDSRNYSLLRVLAGHSDQVAAIAWSGDGRIVTGSYDRTARVWDTDSGALLTTLAGEEGAVAAAIFSPDNKWLVTGGEQGVVRVWDSDGPLSVTLDLSPMHLNVADAAISPDRKHAVTLAQDQRGEFLTFLWNIEDANNPKGNGILIGSEKLVHAVAFSPDGTSLRLLTSNEVGAARLYDITQLDDSSSLRVKQQLDGGNVGGIRAAQFSRDGKRIVTGGNDRNVVLWDLNRDGNFKPNPALVGHKSAVNSVAFSPDGQRLVTTDEERGDAFFWEPARSNQPVPLTDPSDSRQSTGAAFSPDGNQVFIADADGKVHIWDVSQRLPKQLETLEGRQGPLRGLAISLDGKRLLTASEDGTAGLWDVEARQLLALLKAHRDRVNTATFSSDGRRAITSSEDGTARVWDIPLEDRSAAELRQRARCVIPLRWNTITGRIEQAELACVALDP
jgi:WD40 repeat protein